MKIIVIIMSILSGLLLLSVLICGFWIKTQKATLALTNESINFHANLGVSSVVITLLTIGILFFKYFRG